MGRYSRKSRCTHFPRASGTRTLCGAYITGTEWLRSMRTTADFNKIDCRECRAHPDFAEALLTFEIGEYSWGQWLDMHKVPTPPEPVYVPKTGEEYHAEAEARKKADLDRKALRERFEARAKKR